MNVKGYEIEPRADLRRANLRRANLSKQRLPDCPLCGDHRSVHKEGDRAYFCTFCKAAFDDHPEEGGDYSTDPTRRLQYQEAREERRKAKRG